MTQWNLFIVLLQENRKMYCVKSVQIRSFFWSIFSHFWTEYGEIRTSPNAWKYGPEKIRIWTLFTQWWAFYLLFILLRVQEFVKELMKINQFASSHYYKDMWGVKHIDVLSESSILMYWVNTAYWGIALQLYWSYTSAWVFPCKFAAYFQNTFSKEHLWRVAVETTRYS